jgi:hypothetical protein
MAELDKAEDLTFGELARFSYAEIKAYFELHGVAIDWEQLETEVATDLGADVAALNAGTKLDAAREEALLKKIDRATDRAARLVAKETMRSVRRDALDIADDRPDSERFYIWVAKLRRSCRSCEERHGQILAMDQWEDIGEPGDGTTLCRANCECSLVLVPSATNEDTKERVEGLGPG